MNKIFAIETSCDETSLALLKKDQIVECLTWSQIKHFQSYGGVVPQLASQLHSVKLPMLLEKIINNNQILWKEVVCIAYTNEPGLIGCLKIGEVVAKTIGLMKKIKLMPINHHQAHIFAAKLTKNFTFPALAAVVSGGHTQLVYMPKNLVFKVLGTTLDDALGETLDKVGRVLNLSYPAGPYLEKLAKKGKWTYNLPIYHQQNSYNFSFSGVKTAAIRTIEKIGLKNLNLNNFAYSLQKILFENVKKQMQKALEKYPVKNLVLAGGVASNEKLHTTIQEIGLPLVVPPKIYCTDNAAMVGVLAYFKLMEKNCIMNRVN